jgi:hypothetical protein
MNHVYLITFLKEMQYLDTCYGEYDQQELDKDNKLSHHLNLALHSV